MTMRLRRCCASPSSARVGCAAAGTMAPSANASAAAPHSAFDLGIARRADLDPNTAVVSYEFGNRCPGPAIVDLARASVIGRTADGQDVALAPYDPKHEVRALELDGRWMGKEALAYPAQVALVQLCVDAASIAHREGAQWVCFGGDHP